MSPKVKHEICVHNYKSDSNFHSGGKKKQQENRSVG